MKEQSSEICSVIQCTTMQYFDKMLDLNLINHNRKKMEQLSEFIINHWILVTMFVTVAMALLISSLRSFEGVTPVQAVNLMNQGNAVVFDVRTQDEYEKGHIIGALNVPIQKLPELTSDLKKHKGKLILVCCESGSLSGGVVKTLKGLDFGTVQTVKGGVFSWKQENFPLEK